MRGQSRGKLGSRHNLERQESGASGGLHSSFKQSTSSSYGRHGAPVDEEKKVSY